MYRTRTKGTHHIAAALIALTLPCCANAIAQPEANADSDAMVIDMREASPAREPAPVPESSIILDYLSAIEETERTGGAYASQLSEQLLGLGTALQQLDRHEEAIEVFKRGVHLARINSGLYSGEQIALLQGQIRSYRALGDYQQVDERQRYLYRVERRALAGSEEAIDAFMRHARWQRDAFLLAVDEAEAQFGRLPLMWDLYRMALTDMIRTYGNEAAELREPLLGMMEAQYLIAGHRDYRRVDLKKASQFRLVGSNGETFRRGESVLNAILELNVANRVPVDQHARDIVAAGDWAWWFGRDLEAEVYYSEALALTEQSLDPVGLRDELFGLPTPLPRVDGLPGLPQPQWNDTGSLVLSFNISATGRVTELERLREPEVEQERPVNRLLRALRDTRFRPRYVDGVAVETVGLVWSFEPMDWWDDNLDDSDDDGSDDAVADSTATTKSADPGAQAQPRISARATDGNSRAEALSQPSHARQSASVLAQAREQAREQQASKQQVASEQSVANEQPVTSEQQAEQ